MFTQLFARYYRDVARLCARLLGSMDAGDDAAQETFARVLKHLGTLEPDRDPWPWLSTIARRICLDEIRSGKAGAKAASLEAALRSRMREGRATCDVGYGGPTLRVADLTIRPM